MTYLFEKLYDLSILLNRIALRLAAICIFSMLLVMMLQVLARYAFDSPPFWTEELARWLMVWGGLLGASCAFHTHADPAMVHPPADSVIRQKIQACARFAASWGFFAPVLWYTLPYLERQINRTSEGLHVSTVWMSSALPVAIVLILIHGLAGLGVLFSKQIYDREASFSLQSEDHN